MSLRCPLKVTEGVPGRLVKDVPGTSNWDVPWTSDRDDPGMVKRECLGDVLGTFDEDILETSWGPIFSDWESSTPKKPLFLYEIITFDAWFTTVGRNFRG